MERPGHSGLSGGMRRPCIPKRGKGLPGSAGTFGCRQPYDGAGRESASKRGVCSCPSWCAPARLRGRRDASAPHIPCATAPTPPPLLVVSLFCASCHRGARGWGRDLISVKRLFRYRSRDLPVCHRFGAVPDTCASSGDSAVAPSPQDPTGKSGAGWLAVAAPCRAGAVVCRCTMDHGVESPGSPAAATALRDTSPSPSASFSRSPSLASKRG